jgi:heme/copper-type cytochrome/quinol oxidase subunit 2
MDVTAKKRGQITVVLAALALLFGLAAVVAAPGEEGGAEQVVRIEASQYAFSPGVINVRRGDRVTIELVATDVVHGLYLDGYGLQLSAEPGQTERLTFVADRPGSFRFRCSVSCGAMHPFMIGKLRVGNNQLVWAGAGLALVAAAAGLRLGRKAS